MYKAEEKLSVTQKNEVVMTYLKLEKSLVYFNTSLQSNKILIKRLNDDLHTRKGVVRYGLVLRSVDDQQLIAKVLDENNQAIQMTEIYSNILSNTLDAFTSIISNNLNIVIKFLTSITIVLSFPTMVASFYGMNIVLPFQHSPNAFAIVMGMSFILSLISVWALWRMKYF